MRVNTIRNSGWISKCIFDFVIALVGLVLLLPLMVLIVLIIRFTSRGPVFFFQKRIGRNGIIFNVVKFRTMTVSTQSHGTITTATDCRITTIGRVLRKYKLDEFPQLGNVLVGKMSLVGPRPDVPGYADRLQADARKILDLTPGITGPASLLFRDEEHLLTLAHDPKGFNDEVIYPEKVRINLEYMKNWSFWRDFGYIIATVLPIATSRTGLDRYLGLNYETFRERMEQEARRYQP